MLLMDGSAGSGADAEADDDVDAIFTQAQGKVLISRAAEQLRDVKEGGFLFTSTKDVATLVYVAQNMRMDW